MSIYKGSIYKEPQRWQGRVFFCRSILSVENKLLPLPPLKPAKANTRQNVIELLPAFKDKKAGFIMPFCYFFTTRILKDAC